MSGSGHRARSTLPTPENSSPIQPTPAKSSHPTRPKPQCTCPADGGCARVASFLRNRALGLTDGGESLRIEHPRQHLLRGLEHARNVARGEEDEDDEYNEQQGDKCASSPFAVLPKSVLQTLRLRYIPTATPPVLVLRPMPTPIHNCIHEFITTHLLAAGENGFCQQGLLTAAEMDDLTVEFATSLSLPGGPVEEGYSDSTLAAIGFTKRHKRRAVRKEPDVMFFHTPGRLEQRRKRLMQNVSDDEGDDDDNHDSEDDGADDGEDDQLDDQVDDHVDNHDGDVPMTAPPNKAGDAATTAPQPDRSSPLVFPSIVMEIGLTEEYTDLLNDCRDYLISSQGRVRLAVLVHAADTKPDPQPSTTAPTAAMLAPETPPKRRHNTMPTTAGDASSSSSTGSSSPDSAPERYDAVARELATRPPPPLDVFVELWAWTPPRTEGCGPGDIVQRGEKIYLLRNGKIPRMPQRRPHPHPPAPSSALTPTASPGGARKRKRTAARQHKRNTPIVISLPFSRADFGLPSPPPATPQPVLVAVDWAPYSDILIDASMRTEFERTVTRRKRRRAGARVAVGDVGPDWLPGM